MPAYSGQGRERAADCQSYIPQKNRLFFDKTTSETRIWLLDEPNRWTSSRS
jgi:hypothetical protein